MPFPAFDRSRRSSNRLVSGFTISIDLSSCLWMLRLRDFITTIPDLAQDVIRPDNVGAVILSLGAHVIARQFRYIIDLMEKGLITHVVDGADQYMTTSSH